MAKKLLGDEYKDDEYFENTAIKEGLEGTISAIGQTTANLGQFGSSVLGLPIGSPETWRDIYNASTIQNPTEMQSTVNFVGKQIPSAFMVLPFAMGYDYATAKGEALNNNKDLKWIDTAGVIGGDYLGDNIANKFKIPIYYMRPIIKKSLDKIVPVVENGTKRMISKVVGYGTGETINAVDNENDNALTDEILDLLEDEHQIKQILRPKKK